MAFVPCNCKSKFFAQNTPDSGNSRKGDDLGLETMTVSVLSYLCQGGWTLATLVNWICIKEDENINSEGPAPESCGMRALLTDLKVTCNDQSRPTLLYI